MSNETLPSNFSTKHLYVEDDLLEKNGIKLEAIPEEMLRAEDPGELPDLRHLSESMKEKVQSLIEEYEISLSQW